MTPVNVADLTVIVATLLAWSSLLPQIRKLARTGDTEGVSATWAAVGLVSNSGWTAYLLSQRLWAAVPSVVVMTMFYALVLRQLRGAGKPLATSLGRGTAWAATLAATLVFIGWRAMGLVLAWSYVIQISPSVWAAYRSPRPSGVSPGTWGLIGIEAALWGFYGWWFSDAAIVTYATIGVAGSILILLRYLATRRRLALETA